MSKFETFVGAGKALDHYDIPQLAYKVNVGEDHLQAFLNVESRSRGFDRAGRPIILNEPHVFYRNLKGAERDEAVRQGLAYPKWGTKRYPKTSEARYAWLKAAMKINPSAALMACSWGSSQVLGENYRIAGYQSPEQMVLAFMDDEQEHVDAMVNYILGTGIDDDLRNERWATVARIYNGPGYKKNQYDVKMAREFAKLRGVEDKDWSPESPDVELIVPDAAMLKRIQKQLGSLGFVEVGWADGKWGTRTRAAVIAFRMENNLPIYDGIDQEFMAALFGAPDRAIGEERKNTSVADLREAGSRQVAANDGAQVGGTLLGAGGAVAGAGKVLSEVEDTVGTLDRIKDTALPIIEAMTPFLPWLALGLGAYVVYNGHLGKKARLDDQRSGKTAFAGSIK